MVDRYKTVVLVGCPGAGKGTQGITLGSIHGFCHCSSGDIFRAIDATTEAGKLFHDYSARGKLVPDEVTIGLWSQTMLNWIEAGRFDPQHDLLVLDGIPRTVLQAQLMDEHIEVLKVLYLVSADRDAIFQRLLKRALEQDRKDDADEAVIRTRWQIYETETKPVIAQYPDEMVARINAGATPLQVFADLLAVVKPVHEANMLPFDQ
jgi:adenylate kinase